jgi:MaoC dehydratase-like protein
MDWAEPFELRVELGKVREFARATGATGAEYLESDAPPAPPTFLATARLWQGDASSPYHDIDLDLQRLLHGAQEFVFHGPPPRAGQPLQARARVDRIYEKQGRRGGAMTFVEAVTEYRDERGRLVAESRNTSILRERR